MGSVTSTEAANAGPRAAMTPGLAGGMHKLWFQTPEGLREVVTCCAGESRLFKLFGNQANGVEPVKGQARYVIDNIGSPDDHYAIDNAKPLGSGSYGVVYRATNKTFGSVRAIKTVLKSRMKDVQVFRQEVDTMRIMDNPNIAKLFEIFEDANTVYLVMELCEGGELFDRIVKEGKFTEGLAATTMQQILRAVKYVHHLDVVHRDVKPENFLCQNTGPMETVVIKLIDFGMACHLRKGETLKTKVGTPFYVAPEVLKAEYAHAADVWSCGVILFLLISGSPPFTGKTDVEILHAVAKGSISFVGPAWDNVSVEVKLLIKGLLKKNDEKRLTAKEALRDPWIRDFSRQSGGAELLDTMVDSLKKFQGQNKVVKTALHIVASQLKDEQISTLRDTFVALDEDGDGCLSIEEMKGCMENAGFMGDELTAVIEQVDADGSGLIEYSEFLAATLDRKLLVQEDSCWAAFRTFDKNGDGQISAAELAEMLQGNEVGDVCDERQIAELLQEIDTDGDGQISFQEFMTMIRSEINDKPVSSMYRKTGGFLEH